MNRIVLSALTIYRYLLGVYIVLVFAFENTHYFESALNIVYVCFAALSIVIIIGNRKLTIYKECIAIILFCLIAICSIAIPSNIAPSIIRLKTVLLLSTIPISFSLIEKEKGVDYYFKFVLLGALILAVISASNYNFGVSMVGASYNRLGDNIADSNAVAKTFALAAVISLHFGINEKKKWYFVLLGLFGGLILLTQSKSGLVLLVFACACLIVADRRLIPNWEKIVGVLVSIAIIYFVVQTGFLNSYLKRFTNMIIYFKSGNGNLDYSTFERSELKKLGWTYIQKRPLWGYGIGQSTVFLAERGYFHDNYVQVAFETGIIGLLVHYFPYIYSLKKALSNKKNIIIILLLFMLLSGAFNCTYYTKSAYIILALCINENHLHITSRDELD